MTHAVVTEILPADVPLWLSSVGKWELKRVSVPMADEDTFGNLTLGKLAACCAAGLCVWGVIIFGVVEVVARLGV